MASLPTRQPNLQAATFVADRCRIVGTLDNDAKEGTPTLTLGHRLPQHRAILRPQEIEPTSQPPNRGTHE